MTRTLTVKAAWRAAEQSALATAIIFSIIAAASFLSVMFTYTRIPQKILDLAIAYQLSPIIFLLTTGLVLLILGFFMEAVPVTYIVIPVTYPVAQMLKIDPYYFYMATYGFIALGQITPPVCVGAYTAAAVAKVPPTEVIRKLFPTLFLFLTAFAVFILFVPWLPSMISAR